MFEDSVQEDLIIINALHALVLRAFVSSTFEPLLLYKFRKEE